MGPQWNTLVQSLTAAHDDCHMVPQLGRCEQVPVLDADNCKLIMVTMFLDIRSSCSMIPRSMVPVFNGKNQLQSGMALQ